MAIVKGISVFLLIVLVVFLVIQLFYLPMFLFKEAKVELSSETDFGPLFFAKPIVTILPNGADQSTLKVVPVLESDTVEAPIKKGDVFGYANVYYAEKQIGRVDLVAGNDVQRNDLLSATHHVKNFFTSKYMKMIYIAIAAVVLLFIISCIILNLPKRKRRVKYIPYKSSRNIKED